MFVLTSLSLITCESTSPVTSERLLRGQFLSVLLSGCLICSNHIPDRNPEKKSKQSSCPGSGVIGCQLELAVPIPKYYITHNMLIVDFGSL